MFESKDKAEKSLPKTVQVGKYTVRKLVLREYIDVFNKVERIPQELAKLDGLEDGNVASHIGKIVANALPDVIELLAIVTNEPAEELENELDLSTAIDLVVATAELNDFLGVWRKLQGILPEPKKPNPEVANGSNE